MSKPKISVIVPVYKTAKYLPKCIDSILNQSCQDFELILVSDGPEEDHSICDEYARKNSKITVIKDIKKGLGGARNAGLEIAKGEWISFIDSDDWVEPNFLEKMSYGLEQGADISQCGTNIIFDGKIDNELKQNDDNYFEIKNQGFIQLENNIFGSINVGTWNKLYKKNLIQKYKLTFPENMRNEDAYFTWAYWAICEKMYCTPEKMYNYLRRNDSLMAKTFAKNMGVEVLDHLKIGELFYDFLIKNNLFKLRETAFFNSYNICWLFVVSNAAPKYKETGYNIVAKFLKNIEIPEEYKYFRDFLKYSYVKQIKRNHKNKILQNIFSIKNTPDKEHKVITILGIKIKIKQNKS